MTGRELLALVAAENDISVEMLLSASRLRAYAWPRQDAYLRLHEMGWSLARIGRLMQRDHTTVREGIEHARARREEGDEDQ